MSLRHVLASLAVVPTLAVPMTAYASTAGGPGVLPRRPISTCRPTAVG